MSFIIWYPTSFDCFRRHCVLYLLNNINVHYYLWRVDLQSSLSHTHASPPSSYVFIKTQHKKSKETMFRHTARLAERLINRNPELFGPGPVARRPAGGIGAMPPLKGLVACATQGLAVALIGGLAYNFFIGNPEIQKVEDYYKENPPR